MYLVAAHCNESKLRKAVLSVNIGTLSSLISVHMLYDSESCVIISLKVLILDPMQTTLQL
jgi:hypothetical protein